MKVDNAFKMLVETEQNVKSGPGTSMFSRSGASTIAMHKVFKQKYSSINELVAEKRMNRKVKRQNLAEDEEPDAATQRLPAITENDENQAIVEVPGLAEELRRVEKNYTQMQKEGQQKNGKDRNGRGSKMSSISGKESTKEKMPTTAKAGAAKVPNKNNADWLNLDDLLVSIPKTKRELEDAGN